MSTQPNRRPTRRRAEHLLAAPADRRPGNRPADEQRGIRRPDGTSTLAAVLAAARRPAQEGELRGEEAALAAFRAAFPHPVPRTAPRRRRLSMIKTAVARLIPLKLALAAAAATAAAGGLALAANAGVLPNPVKPHAPQGSPSPDSSGKPTAHPTGKGSAPTASPASLQGLCRAYSAVADNPGKALENPAFGALLEAAGGAANVPAFCARQAADQPGNAPTDKPGGKPSEHPTGGPTDKPGNRPTGKPAGKPGSAPTVHPTGQGR